MKTLTIGIDGMHCHSCVSSIEEALAGVDGVETASASLAAHSATVTFDPVRTDLRAQAAAIAAAGYAVTASGGAARAGGGGCCGSRGGGCCG